MPVDTVDGTVIAQKALSAVLRTGQRFGTEHLIAVLRGEATGKVRQHSHDRLPTFGVGADIGKALWRSYLRQLAATDVLKIDIGGYGALKLGERAHDVLKGVESVALHLEAVMDTGKRRERRQAIEPPPRNMDPVLLARLKQVRLEIAKAESVPAFAVFHDRSLQDMAVRKPQSLERLADCHGVGSSKLDRFGNRILAVLKEATGLQPPVETERDAVQRIPAAEQALAGEFDSQLFRRLKALRLQIALEEDVAPHEVLHKFSLQEMAVNRPQTLDRLGECYGVDAERIERYGKRLLAVLRTDKSEPVNSGDTLKPELQDLTPEPDLSDRHDPVMFAKLDALRFEIARTEAISPPAVFPDRTLMEMSALLPRSLDALAECHGVGPLKLKRYGTRFLDLICAATDS